MTRTLKEIGKYPIVGDQLRVHTPHGYAIATVSVVATDARSVELSAVPVLGDPYTYRIPRDAWERKCQAPNHPVEVTL